MLLPTLILSLSFSLRVCVGEEDDAASSLAGSAAVSWLYDDDDVTVPFPETVGEEDVEPADENVREYCNEDDTRRGDDDNCVNVLLWHSVRDWGSNVFGDSRREDETEPEYATMISGRTGISLICGGSESTVVHAWIMGSIGLYGW